MEELILGIVGFGNMGSAIYERIKEFGVFKVSDKDISKISQLARENIADRLKDLADQCDIIILAVKPQDFEGVLNEIKGQVKGKLIISIAAGITTAYIEKFLGQVRVIRVMPNMPAKIGEGISCLCKGSFASAADLEFSERLFKELGKTLILEENMMDAATAISGSGPGLFYDSISGKPSGEWIAYANEYFTPGLIKAARSLGFSDEQAELLSATTSKGSLSLMDVTGLSPQQLCGQVTSKGGTTEAGLEVLHKGGSLQEAVKAAYRRAAELSRS
jgi:pyrroline-5-carboxylate reductase